jgi:plastocyanin
VLLAVLPLTAGSVTGRVELRDSKNAAVRKKKDFSSVVVWLEAADGRALAALPGRARMVQKFKTFTPHVLAVTVGSTIDFPNYDPIFHNAFSNYDGQLFDVGLYPPGTSRSVRFTKPGTVRVFCNIHAAMSAVIVVLPTPYFDTSKKDGSFEMARVAPGEYWLRVFHEHATSETLDSLARRVNVGEGGLGLGNIVISESGFLELPHQNKYGRDYSVEPDDRGAYPAVRK